MKNFEQVGFEKGVGCWDFLKLVVLLVFVVVVVIVVGMIV